MPVSLPLTDIEAAAARIAPDVIETPVTPWTGPDLPALLPPGTDLVVKFELFQRTGSFKARGAINNVLTLPESERARGLVAISAGNHAIALAYAARMIGASVKVVMPKSASQFRVARCRDLGAEVIQVDDIAKGFELVGKLRDDEGRTFVHPFEGQRTLEGTGTLGREFLKQAGRLDAVIVPVGGGGLIGGMAAAIKQLSPETKVFGVEPEGERGMTDSIAGGAPLSKVPVKTIADSLGAPLHMPLSFALVRDHVDEMVTVGDDAMVDALGLIFRDLKLAVEPAPAAGIAALLGPLRARLEGKRVGLLMCGTNIDAVTFGAYLAAARPLS